MTTAGTSSVSGWTPRRTPNANLFLKPGVILRGGNLVPKPSDVSSGHAYRSLFAVWDWDGWIKPQIDAMATVGANVIRLIGDLEGVNDGTFSQATYNSRWGQLIDYAASKGMWTYPACGGVSQVSTGTLTNGQITNTLVAAATFFHSKKPNIVGLDLIQESVRQQVSGSYAMSFASMFTPAVRAVTDLPVTYSNSDAGFFGASRFIFPLWKEVLRPYVDFWDIHSYSNMAPATLVRAFWGQGETKPVLIGEFGKAADAGPAAQAAHYEATLKMVNFRPGGLHVAGVLSWATFDQGSGANAFGMFETNGTPRTHMTDVFRRFPTS